MAIKSAIIQLENPNQGFVIGFTDDETEFASPTNRLLNVSGEKVFVMKQEQIDTVQIGWYYENGTFRSTK
jgi:hypothetical protein